jgi:hypothetical protein
MTAKTTNEHNVIMHCFIKCLLVIYIMYTYHNVKFQVEKPKGFKCGTFGASTLSERHLATGDFEGLLSIWFVNSHRNFHFLY